MTAHPLPKTETNDLNESWDAAPPPAPVLLPDELPEGWRLVCVGDVATVSSGGTPSRNNPQYWGGLIPWVTTSAIDFNPITEPSEMITEDGLRESSARIYPAQTVLMAMYGQGATRGRVAILGFPASVNQACAALQTKSNVLPSFLFYSLMLRYREIRNIGHGGNQKNLNANLIRGLQLPLPPLPEQEAIVEILDAADAAVRNVADLLDAKMRHKRAVAEELLTGRRRFPEFAGQEWESLQIGDIATHRCERCPAGQVLPVLSCTKHHGLVLSSEYFGKRIHSEDLSNYKAVHRGDFAYATNHIEEGSIGLQNICEVGLVSPMYTVFRTEADRADSDFLFGLLKLDIYRQLFASRTNSSVNRRGSLRWPAFAELPLNLPSLAEQRRIAECLSLMDEEIALRRRQREALKKQKQGLMQKLLTGKLRVRTETAFAAAPLPPIHGGLGGPPRTIIPMNE